MNLPNTGQGEHIRTTHEIKQATRSSNQEITTEVELSNLITDRSSTVCDTRSKHRTIAKTTSLIKDLAAKLASGGNDEDQWLGTNTFTGNIEIDSQIGATRSQFLDFAHEL
jgi:hypothetical protein